jgi:exodeoxyribonuclease V alpha subunit
MAEREAGALFEGQLRGTVARVLFENPDSGWAVLHLDVEGGLPATVVGPLAPVFPGEALEIDGRWEDDSRFGRQFRATAAIPVVPDTESGTRKYLASGVIPGIGPELARRLTDRFGADTLSILDEEPERLLAVRGIGPKRLEEIRNAWVERSAERQARIFLQGHGLGPAMTEKILKAWGTETIARIQREPYALVREVRGIGFRTADGLALRIGWEPAAPERIGAGLAHALTLAADRGDCFAPRERLTQGVVKLLDLDDSESVGDVITSEARTGRLVLEGEGDDERVYAARLYAAEHRVALRLAMLAAEAEEDLGPADRLDGVIRQAEHDLRIELGALQREAVAGALAQRLLVVTGGPGTGKTTLVNVLVRCAEMLDLDVALAAPTGRAAKRLEQATGLAGTTLHRLLEYRFDSGFNRGPDNPVEADLLVVDEASMIDLGLMDAFLAALAPGTRLLLVGDADQLPPVGPGAVLRDLIESERVPTVRLTTIYRQAEQSLIIRNAHRVNSGSLPQSSGSESLSDALADFYVIDERDPERALEIVLRLVTRRIPDRFGLDPRRDIQVLAPMHRGRCGVARLNARLQDALNPGTEAAEVDRPRLRAGDRVMQMRNDYDREVFNGDIGRVFEVDDSEGVAVEFEGRMVGYEKGAINDLALAYATTVHKSQGSEYPAVVCVLLPEHHIMLQRNLLYTAITRAREVAVLVTTERSLARAVDNNEPSARCTTLAERIVVAWRRVLAGPARGLVSALDEMEIES